MYSVNDRVVHVTTGRKAIIAATKEYGKTIPYNLIPERTIFPDEGMDYLIYYFSEDLSSSIEDKEIYRGSASVKEHELSILNKKTFNSHLPN